MTPIIQAQLASLLRSLLWVLGTYLVRKGIWTNAAAERYIEGAAPIIIALGWSYWKNHTNRVKVVTALAMPQGSTENDLNTQITKATPSVSTPVNTPPLIPAQTK
jgi:hypothetical protein